VLFTAEDTIARGVGPSNAGLPMSYMRVLFTDPQLISEAKASVLVSAMNDFEEVVAEGLPRSNPLLGARAATKRMSQKMLFLRLPALLLAALGIAVVGYYLFLVSGLIARKRELETVMLRSRGLSAYQVIRVQVIEAVVTVGLPAAMAPLLAYLAIGYAGRLPVFESLTHGQNLPVELSPMAWVWAAGAAVVAFLIVLLPTLLVARSGVSNVDRTRARPDSPPVFQRLYFDLLVIILGGLFLWEITTRGVASTDREGEIVTDPTLLFAPAMLLISVALVMLRVFPVITKASAWLATRFTSASTAVGFWRLGRSPYWYAWPVLLIILGTGLGVMVGTLGSTLERSSQDQIYYDNGASMRIKPGSFKSDVREGDIAELLAIDGVNMATRAFRQKAKFGTTDRGMEFEVLAVESDSFADMAWFRDDFSDDTLEELLDRVNVPSTPEPLMLPPGTTDLAAWTKQDPYVRDHFFWVILKGAENRHSPVTLGQIGDTWSRQSGSVPENLVEPIEITSLVTFMQATNDGGAPTTWSFDDLVAIGPDFETVLLDFEGESLWTPLPTSEGLADTYIEASEPDGIGDPGSVIGQMTLGRGTVIGVRGAYRSSTGDPMPVIVSDNFLEQTAIVLGEPTVVQIGGGFIPIVPIGKANLFPTLEPDKQPFMILDVNTLLAFVELRGLVYMDANEVFLDIDAENHSGITAELREIFRSGSLLDREGRIEQSVIDPLTVAGWRGMGVVSLIIGGIALVLGYVTYLGAHSTRTIHDSAYLRAMGLSKPGFMRSALIEHGIVAFIGVAVGVSAGLVASRVAVGAIAYSETGRALLPPFILQTDWWPVFTILAIAAVAGLVGVISSFIGFLRKPLHELTRTSGG
jgi:MFS family permease